MSLRQTLVALSCIAALYACMARTGPKDEPGQESSSTELEKNLAIAEEPESSSLEGWTAETFALPPEFAPELPKGRESLRFPPGWRDPAAEDFWSYAFVMWIEEPAPDEARIQELLETYDDGLLSSFAAGKQKDIRGNPAQVEVVRTAKSSFEASMRVIDAFATFEPIELRVVVDTFAEADRRTAMQIRVSPKPMDHAIWRSLELAIASIVSREGPLRGK